MEGSEVSFKISLIDVASGGGEAGVGVGKRWFGEARWGKLGTYCLKVLMVLETSLLTCLGPHEARLVAPWCQAVSRWGVGWGGLGGWELSGIPSSGEPFLPGPTKGFSPGPWVGFLIHEAASRKLKGEWECCSQVVCPQQKGPWRCLISTFKKGFCGQTS